MEWLTYYSRNFQVAIRPKVEKRARELKVDVVLKIKDEEIRICGDPVEDHGLQMVKHVAGSSIRAEQGIAPRRQEHSVKVCSFHSLLSPTDPVFPSPKWKVLGTDNRRTPQVATSRGSAPDLGPL